MSKPILFLLLLLLMSCSGKPGSGKDVFIYNSLFLSIPILSLLYFSVTQWLKKMKRSNSSFLLGSLKYFKISLICLGMFFVSMIIVNFVAPYRVYDDSSRGMKEEGHLLQDTLKEYEGFKELVEMDMHDIPLSVEYVDFLTKGGYTGDLFTLKEKIKASHSQSVIIGDYVDINNSVDAMLVAYTEYKLTDFHIAYPYLKKFVHDTMHYNCQLTAGKLYEAFNDYEKAEKAYLTELNNPIGNYSEAIKSLATLYMMQGRYEDVSLLSQSYDYWMEFMPVNVSVRASRNIMDVWLYLRCVWAYIYNGLNAWGGAGAFIISLAYFIFLYKVDVFRKEPLFGLIVTFLMGCLSPTMVFFLSDILSEYTPIRNNVISEYFIQVGLIEEVVKLIPFLIVLNFTKLIQEPYDFILYVSMSALGFAFTENLIYFDVNQIGLIQMRALTSVVGHMTFSSIIAYSMVYSSFKKGKKNLILPTLLGLLIASIAHGVYDIFAVVEGLVVFFVLFFLYLVINWGIMLNNTLNNSPYFNLLKVKKVENIRTWMSVVLLFVLLFEYVLRAFQVGGFWANDLLLGAFFFIFYLWIYISSSIGSLDFFNGYWESVGYSENMKGILLPRMANHRVYLGYNVVISPSRGNNPNGIQELRGQLVSRRIARGDKDWYVLKLKDNLNAPGYYNNIVLVWFLDYDSTISEDKNIKVKVHLIKDSEDLKSLEITKTSLLLKGFLNEL